MRVEAVSGLLEDNAMQDGLHAGRLQGKRRGRREA